MWNYMDYFLMYLFHSIFITFPLVNKKYGKYGSNHHAKKKWGTPSSVISVSLAILHSYVKLPEGEQISVWKNSFFLP